ncbi:Serine threonine kinase [Olea europaea subsp. europaea]|uniref:Serine threonine kinase n=1 Tax=Olea europaea subsp. europaea TaxID=158383 RepID=A0A8S0QGY7_OLEEU|nr:Serine threonine kinase [Olea europaea subsp. europaea]
MTGRKSISFEVPEEERNLATYFVQSVKENHLYKILNARVLREGSFKQLHAVTKLVERCLKLNGKERPTMKEVAMELERFRKHNVQTWIQQEIPQKSVALGLTTEEPDLYQVSINSEFVIGEFSEQNTMESCRYMLSTLLAKW